MSRLGDFENAIVARLGTATIGGSPAFQVIEGASGGWRPANREALSRERAPAAYVGFIEEPTAPEVRESVRGVKFVVLIAERTARVESDARHGDVTTVGAFRLIDAARGVLDDWGIADGLQLVNVHVRFVEADDRSAVYEILYRVWPIVIEEEMPLILFDGGSIFGSDSRMALEAGPDRAEGIEFAYHGRDTVYAKTLAANTRTLVLRGDLRATSHSMLNALETDIEDGVKSAKSGTLVESGVRSFNGCVLSALFRRGGRRVEGERIVQAADVLFVQNTA